MLLYNKSLDAPGRRHQIRVHTSWEGHPTVTDEKRPPNVMNSMIMLYDNVMIIHYTNVSIL